MSNASQGSNFNIVGLLVALVLLLVIAAVLVPVMAYQRRSAMRAQSDDQLRTIYVAVLISAQASILGRQDGYFVGLDLRFGTVIPDGPETSYSGDGTHPAARFGILLNNNAFAPQVLVSPADPNKTIVVKDSSLDRFQTLTPDHYSFALLGLLGTESERTGWMDTFESDSVIISDRAIGSDPSDISSVWTDPEAGQWEGAIVHNDSSLSFETSQSIENTQYGQGQVNGLDDLFRAPGAIVLHMS